MSFGKDGKLSSALNSATQAGATYGGYSGRQNPKLQALEQERASYYALQKQKATDSVANTYNAMFPQQQAPVSNTYNSMIQAPAPMHLSAEQAPFQPYRSPIVQRSGNRSYIGQGGQVPTGFDFAAMGTPEVAGAIQNGNFGQFDFLRGTRG